MEEAEAYMRRCYLPVGVAVKVERVRLTHELERRTGFKQLGNELGIGFEACAFFKF